MGSNPILAARDEAPAQALEPVRPPRRKLPGGGLAERSKAHAWKACRGATPSRVRTPQPPPRNPLIHLRVPQAVVRWSVLGPCRFARAASRTISRRSASASIPTEWSASKSRFADRTGRDLPSCTVSP
jgi:hypothetical protein